MTKEFTDTLMALIEAIILVGAQAPYLYPTPEGGIQAEWSVPEKAAEILFFLSLDGSVLAVRTTPDADLDEKVKPTDATTDRLAKLLRDVGVVEK